MSAPAETTKATALSDPESPTTARPLEMDDDDVQESGLLGGGESTHNAPATIIPPVGEEAPPAKPPRPLTEQQKNEAILKEAFPSIDMTIIKAVLSASGGRIDPAFNALLEMTDPDAVQHEPEEVPPPQPPRPAVTAQLTQLEADELLARQLAEHYENVGSYEARTTNRGQGDGRPRPRPREQTGLKPNELQDREHSFFDDDLPVIQERLKQGFFETQGKVNEWITGLKKKFDEEFIDEEDGTQRQKAGPYPGRGAGESSRRSGDYERYDADPEVLSDDFAGMKFNADGTPRRDNKPLPNPDLFKPPPPSKSPKPSDGRKVAFRDAADEIDVYGSSPRLAPQDGAATSRAKPSKWQPLSTVEPSPITDNDPFSLGDSEDEKEAKDKTGTKEIKLDDNERLKQAAAEAMADSLVDSKKETATVDASAKKD